MDRLKTAMAALQAETARLGAPKVQGSDLYFGNTKASDDLVSAFVRQHGGHAGLLVKSESEGGYVFIATTLGCVGSKLGGADRDAIAKLNNGEGYSGIIPGRADQILGNTLYEPIKDASGVIGAYLVACKK